MISAGIPTIYIYIFIFIFIYLFNLFIHKSSASETWQVQSYGSPALSAYSVLATIQLNVLSSRISTHTLPVMPVVNRTAKQDI